MILGVSMQMTETEREIVTREMMKGFNDKAKEAGTRVTGGQTVLNPWPMIGGTAISTLKKEEVIYPNNANEGDIIVLTKPLGTQVIVNAVQWLIDGNTKWNKVKEIISEEQLWESYSISEESMCRLNLETAKIMKKYRIGACTDVTGFGIKGHAENLVIAQKKSLNIVIEKLPIIRNSDKINNNVFNFKLIEGYSAETSGGLFIIMNKDDAISFVEDMKANNQWVQIIGYTEEGTRQVIIKDNIEIIQY